MKTIHITEMGTLVHIWGLFENIKKNANNNYN